MEQRYELFVGVDWGSEAHQVAVIDGDRHLLAQRSIEHSGLALSQLVDWLAGKADPSRIAIAIEVPRGPVVETLVERGFQVFSLNPKQLDRFRDRHTAAGAKDDRRDAFVLADSLRTDQPAFRRVRLDDPLIIQLRELSRMDEDLQKQLSRLSNQLREQLNRFYVQILKICPAADEPWAWSLLELVPTPAQGARVRVAAVKRVLRENRIRRLTADDVIAALKEPALVVAPGATEAASKHIEYLLPALQLASQQRKRCGKEIEALLETLGSEENEPGQNREHRDVQILQSFPGVGRIVAATMLAEASQPLGDRDYNTLRAQAGSAPVTYQSGKKLTVRMRRACNPRLRNALYSWSQANVRSDPTGRKAYAELRAKGHSHARALRTIADRLLRVLISMLRTGTLYDPARRGLAVA